MGLLSQALGTLGRIRGNGVQQGERAFEDTLALGDFWTSTDGDVALVTSDYRDLGAGFKVPPQQRIMWGQGAENAPDNQGYCYVRTGKTTDTTETTGIEGTYRFSISDNGKFARTVVMQERSERLEASQTDRRIMKPFPRFEGRVAVEDEYLLVSLKPDSASLTADQNGTNSKWILPITRIAKVLI